MEGEFDYTFKYEWGACYPRYWIETGNTNVRHIYIPI